MSRSRINRRASSNATAYNTGNTISLVREFIALTKPRVNLLIMFTAIVGMLLAHNSVLNYELIFFASIGIGLAASAAAIINHVVDQKIDSIMDRTKSRPLVNGSIKPQHAIYFALFLSFASITLLYLLVNTLTALLTFISIITEVKKSRNYWIITIKQIKPLDILKHLYQ